jgi:hypothetical protein
MALSPTPQEFIDKLLQGKPATQIKKKKPIAKGFNERQRIPNKPIAPLGQTPSYSSSTPVSFQAQLRDRENASFFNRAPKQWGRPVGQDRRSERAKESSLGGGNTGAFEREGAKPFGAGMGGARPASRASARKLMRRRDTTARVSQAAQRSAEDTRKFFDR